LFLLWLNLARETELKTKNFTEMYLEQIIKENPGINLTVNAGELLEFGQSIAHRAVKTFLEKNDEKVYSRKDVIQKFGICEATLWRWEKMNLIEINKIGNRVFYPAHYLFLILTGKKPELQPLKYLLQED
jgi:hypothetical protein